MKTVRLLVTLTMFIGFVALVIGLSLKLKEKYQNNRISETSALECPLEERKHVGLGTLIGTATNTSMSSLAILLVEEVKPNGVFISDVAGNSPAAKAGVKQFDIIIEINGARFSSQEEFLTLVPKEVGKPVSLLLFRQGPHALLKEVNTTIAEFDLADFVELGKDIPMYSLGNFPLLDEKKIIGISRVDDLGESGFTYTYNFTNNTEEEMRVKFSPTADFILKPNAEAEIITVSCDIPWEGGAFLDIEVLTEQTDTTINTGGIVAAVVPVKE